MHHLTPAENTLRNQSAAAIIGGQFDQNEVLLPYQKRWIADKSDLKLQRNLAVLIDLGRGGRCRAQWLDGRQRGRL